VLFEPLLLELLFELFFALLEELFLELLEELFWLSEFVYLLFSLLDILKSSCYFNVTGVVFLIFLKIFKKYICRSV